MQIRKIGNISLYQSSVFDNFPKIVHGFTTREGGVSTGEYESLSLSPYRGDDINNVHKNEKILCESLSLDYARLSSTKQEHTDNIEIIDENSIGIGVHSPWGKGVDAVITREKSVPILCYSADCVPIIMYAADIEAIAAIHSGWKGTAKRIAGKTVKKLTEMGANPKSIYAAIGPCIGKCCYEVSGDVALQFNKKHYTEKPDGKYMLDLQQANFDIIADAGVTAGNISVSDICTRCHNDLFFSHRGQGGTSGTLGGIIAIKD